VEVILLIGTIIGYGISLAFSLSGKERLTNYFLYFAVLLNLSTLISRSVTAQHPPFTNLYETCILLAFLLILRIMVWKRQFNPQIRTILIGIAMGILIVALLLPRSMQLPRPLMPALNSIWMYLHVPAYFFGYIALLFAGIYAFISLLHKTGHDSTNTILKRLDSEVKIAFFFLNIGIITGGIWAYGSWGNYWAWDPKETWALINVLTLAFYFHLQTPTKVKKAIIVLIALLSVIFTYWGVSLILVGLHSYA